jgi:hypothetical protein
MSKSRTVSSASTSFSVSVGGPTLVELNIAAFGPSELCDLLPQRVRAAFVF